MIRPYLLILLFSLMGLSLCAQNGTEDKEQAELIISASAFYAFENPGGDLSTRFGFNNKIGLTFSVKLKSNWVLMLEGGYMFGEELKEEAYSILDPLKTEFGQITSQYGTPGQIALGERGYTIMAKAGKILPFLQTNKNSGPIILGGIGFIEHQIRIDNQGNDIPQIFGDYKKGYDHLTNGIAFSQFFGYQHYAMNKMMNFYIGFEFTQALTKNRRGFNYNDMEFDNENRLDMLYSIKVGVVVPFSRRSVDNVYYSH